MTPAFVLPSVRLSLPWGIRLYFVAFGVVWIGILTTTAVRAQHSDIPVAVAMLAVGGLVIGSTLRLGVTAVDDQIVIRNRLRTTRLTRAEVEGFRAGPAPNQGLPISHCVYALTRDGRLVALVVTARSGFRGPPKHVRDDLACLRGWLGPTVGET